MNIEEIRKKNKHRALDDNEVQFILSKLEIAEKALEEYTEDEQHCARCDGTTYDTGNGKVAREALQQIRS